MDEFGLVVYSERRGVFVDDSPAVAGQTHTKFAVNTGVHTFRLDGPADFQPETITVAVEQTSWLLPKIITFRPRTAN